MYLCENNIYNADNMTDVMTHELIHAFDNCRAKVDFLDPRHLACTEVRRPPVYPRPPCLFNARARTHLFSNLRPPYADPGGEPQRRLLLQHREL